MKNLSIYELFEDLKKVLKKSHCWVEIEDQSIARCMYFSNTLISRSTLSCIKQKGLISPETVVEERRKFYIEDDNLIEKKTISICNKAILHNNTPMSSRDYFALPDDIAFEAPVSETITQHSNIIYLAFDLGQDERLEERPHSFEQMSLLKRVKWQSLDQIEKELEYILVHHAGYVSSIRKPTVATFFFQKNKYTVCSDWQRQNRVFSISKNNEDFKKYPSLRDLINDVGLGKFQFGIDHDGGD